MGHRAGSVRGVSPWANRCTHLLVYLGPILNFSYNHPHDVTPVGRGEGKELLVGGDIMIP